MRSSHLAALLLSSGLHYSSVQGQQQYDTQQQQPLSDVELHGSARDGIKQVAVIGAGAAGSSAAFHLRRFAAAASIPMNITVYESNPYVGGRSTTVFPYDSPLQPPLELGASIFVKVNQILYEASQEFNLSTGSMKPSLSRADDNTIPELGVYDGSMVVFSQTGSSYWDLAKLVWRYGLAPWRTLRLMQGTVGKFLQMYSAPVFPFADLTTTVADLGLADTIAVTGDVFLRVNGIDDAFSHDVVQASTRVNYAQNLDVIHGLETMVCMAADGAMSIEGGNWRIFDHMVTSSGAVRALATKAHSITRLATGDLEIEANPSAADSVPGDTWRATFDEVILAAPMQFSGIEWADTVGLLHRPDTIPYVRLHVTIFTSPHLLDPKAFGLAPTDRVPRSLLTTTPSADGPKPEFLSISLLRDVVNPETGELEYAYKVFTLHRIRTRFLRKVLGLAAEQPDDDGDQELPREHVSWILRKVWNSYPRELPRITFEPTKLADDVWYTSGIESFISTMETSALMGKNVARLIVDKWIAGSGTQ